MSYYVINGIKLDTPEHMLKNYMDNIDRNNKFDKIKINALERIQQLLNNYPKLTLEIERKRPRQYEDQDRVNNNPLKVSRLSFPINSDDENQDIINLLQIKEQKEIKEKQEKDLVFKKI